MFEILKLVVELASKLLNPQTLREARKRKKLATLGKELFLCLNQLNDVIFTGYKILDWLESSVKKRQQLFLHDVPFLLSVQMVNLDKFGNTLLQLSRELELIDSVAFHRLQLFFHNKFAIVSALAGMFHSGELPLLVNQTSLRRLKGFLTDGTAEDFRMELVIHVIDDLEKSKVATVSALTAEAHKRIKTYLAKNHPQDQLKEMEVLSEALHSTLKTHSDISDILITVSDLRRRGYYDNPR